MQNLENTMQAHVGVPLYELPKDPITSTRFFFTPTNTKSLVEDLRAEDMNLFMRDGKEAGNYFLKTSMKMAKMALSSNDPYGNFKRSMEEMVEAYRISELPRLQELLRCYLALNQKKNHKVIVLAFLDLLADLNNQNMVMTSA